MTEVTIDHPKWMLHLGAVNGFYHFNPIGQSAASFDLVQPFTFARHHGNFPAHASVFFLNILALFNASAAQDGKDNSFLPGEQDMRFRNIMGTVRRCRDRMHQARVRVHTNVRLHAKVPLVDLIGLVHFRIAHAFVVLGRTGCRNQGGIHHRVVL